MKSFSAIAALTVLMWTWLPFVLDESQQREQVFAYVTLSKPHFVLKEPVTYLETQGTCENVDPERTEISIPLSFKSLSAPGTEMSTLWGSLGICGTNEQVHYTGGIINLN
jgi:hypothetical protein